MLEALQDIEIASRLVGFDGETDDLMDDKYKKLRCEITPLSHDSEDYQIGVPKKFFHLKRKGSMINLLLTDDSLTIECFFGMVSCSDISSRLTNFVGMLSQGLRIAPPEAPATGYMVLSLFLSQCVLQFAYIANKSAQYCYTDKRNPLGLMLLSEVALGEVYELNKVKKKPKEPECVKWRDNVVVPCGKLVPSRVKASELMYNVYIVYGTAQVKMQFLLKVRFHHKSNEVTVHIYGGGGCGFVNS
ncbi:hypothetical protein FEM48_Zijuj09G0054300 [Ziziphus jujuba var. spinosa]|uniref:Poly [ADP-ribose] polymerase n=1 Tax=Ziziphus jujuba var. spinosa TaxID=714518 RepID=A0A978UR50_ZIZJJ|nr:hypothetical protein FEM48_Zijuj09G0054300 [Ziziphus jujuba var. spinosa]